MTDSILTRHDGNLFEIILNRIEKRNAIDWPMMQALGEAIELAERAPGNRVVLIHSDGKGFSSGIDLTAFSKIGELFGENWASRLPNIVGTLQSILNKIARCNLPTIALIRGYALGLGLEIAMACDFRIVARGAKIGLPESRLGMIPGAGGTTRLTHLVGPGRAKEWIMTGRMIDLEEARLAGLVNAVVPANELLARGKTLAEELILAAPMAVSHAKRVIDGIEDLDHGLQLEAWAQNHLMRTEDFQARLQTAIAR